jgi:hypothetical protein
MTRPYTRPIQKYYFQSILICPGSLFSSLYQYFEPQLMHFNLKRRDTSGSSVIQISEKTTKIAEKRYILNSL